MVVAESLPADCEKAWLHPGEEEAMKNVLFGWENEKRRMREGGDGGNASIKSE